MKESHRVEKNCEGEKRHSKDSVENQSIIKIRLVMEKALGKLNWCETNDLLHQNLNKESEGEDN